MDKQDSKKRANSAYVYRMMDGRHEWDYGQGRIVTCSPEKGSAAARHFLLNYGIKQWIQDGGAVSADERGRVDPQAKYEGMLERAQLIESGVDQLLRRGGGIKGDDTGLTVLALMRVRKLDIDGANALIDKIAAKNGIERKAVIANMATKNPDIIRAVGEIKAERAAKSAVDAGDLLDEMGDPQADDEDEDADSDA
ncbi:MAG TPA: hypothetical protein PKV98_07780 [Burkholderiaceae bacterium]|nr:hypothetical protein [Burkholderiaceae bacterium]